MSKRENYLDDDTDSDELCRLVETGQLPRSSVITADDLSMKPGQTLKEKAKELGVSVLTFASGRPSGRAPAGHRTMCLNEPGTTIGCAIDGLRKTGRRWFRKRLQEVARGI
jgi:hypothetical protein